MPHHRVVRWYNFRDRRASEDQFAQRVVNAFGADAIIAYGSTTGFHAFRGLPPSPVQGLRERLVARGLTVVRTPEFWTTKSCSRCGQLLCEDASRAKLNPTTGRSQAPHGIRRCTSATCEGPRRLPFRWNRDANAALNIRVNLIHRLQTGRWPNRDPQRPPNEAEDAQLRAAASIRCRRRVTANVQA